MEVKMKKIVALLLALVMVFGLAACGGGSTPANNNAAPSGNNAADNTTKEYSFPKNVTIYIPQKVGAMLDQSGRIMFDFLQESFPNTKFKIENTDGSGNDHAKIVSEAKGDGSVLMFHGAGAIVQYYSGDWDYNLADTSKYIAVAGNVGQEQPSGGVFLINANETRFNDIPSLIAYIKAHPGEIRCSWGTGTPHEVRMKLILNYFGITDKDVIWNPGGTPDVRAWIQGGNTDVAVMTETTSAADIKAGKVKGILNSVCNRDLYTEDLAPLKDVPIVPEVEGVKAEDAQGLICAWPMTIYAPASMERGMVEWINAQCAKIRDNADYMKRIKGLGSTNTYQIFSVDEINKIQQDADKQIKTVFDAFKN